MKLGCKQCGIYAAHEPCPDCGNPVHIGHHYLCPHEPMSAIRGGLDGYWDEHIDPSGKPAWISNPGDKRKYLKAQWENDHIVHVMEKR